MLVLQTLVGRRARVTVAIPENGAGEISLQAGGEQTAQLAWSADGATVPLGREVVIQDVRGTRFIVAVVKVVEPEGVYR
jgi:membrane protein implicated in regulation of membrane protease activity